MRKEVRNTNRRRCWTSDCQFLRVKAKKCVR